MEFVNPFIIANNPLFTNGAINNPSHITGIIPIINNIAVVLFSSCLVFNFFFLLEKSFLWGFYCF